MIKRFYEAEEEFRAITFTSKNQTKLIGITADGKSIFLIDTLEGSIKLLLDTIATATNKFTSISMKNDTNILVGTFSGEVIEISIENNNIKIIEKKKTKSLLPILFIFDAGTFVDSQGRLFVNDKLILDDEILQPVALLESNSIFYFVKHSSIHIYDTKNEKLTSFNSPNLIFCAAEFDQNNQLVLCTICNQLYIFDSNQMKLKEFDCDDSDDLEEDLERESEPEDLNSESHDFDGKNCRILGLIKSPDQVSDLIVLKVDEAKKEAKLEIIKSKCIPGTQLSTTNTAITTNNARDSTTTATTTADTAADSASIVCPLCQTTQNIPLKSKTCTNGHPITICYNSKTLINTHFQTYRCRSCHLAYSENPQSCVRCGSLITKIQIL